MAKIEHVSHVKSKLTREILPEEFYGLTPTDNNSDEADSSPVKLNLAKRPTPDKIVLGEIAVNYKKGHETITIKNDEDEIVAFVNENDFKNTQEIIANAIATEKNERKQDIEIVKNGGGSKKDIEEIKQDIDVIDLTVSSALNDLNSRINEQEGNFDTLSDKIDNAVDKIKEDMEDNELVVSSALNDLNTRIIEQNSDFETLENNLDSLESDVETMQTAIETVNDKIDNSFENFDESFDKFEHVISTSLNDLNNRIENTNVKTETIEENFNKKFDDNEFIVSSSLNDLNTRIITNKNIIDDLRQQIADLTARVAILENNN